MLGPAALQKTNHGPYFGISGLWCWISDPYPTERIVMEYLWMLTAVPISFVLYTLIFLRLRGNIYVHDGKMRFRKINSENSWKYNAGRDYVDVQLTSTARGMVGFPIIFTIVVLPIAVCRFVEWSGKDVPIEATIFADAVFSLTGVFDLLLFATTRSLLPSDGIFPTWLAPRPKVPAEVLEHGILPYNAHDFASAHGFTDMYQAETESTMASLPPRTQASMGRSNRHMRPPRPLSLGEISHPVPLSIPENVAVRELSPSPISEKTVRRYSQGIDAGRSEPHSAGWDDIDLGRNVSPADDGFGGFPRRMERDSQSTAFTVSAYIYNNRGSDEGVPPVPPGAGIDIHAGSHDADDDDEQSLVRRGERDSFGSADVQRPHPAARRV